MRTGSLVERYVRNRMPLQMAANWLGVIGSLFFSLQNMSTNWGGTFADDTSLTDTVKNNTLAGIAWDEQYLKVGALLIAWCAYVLGAELQGNLTPGRYKRIMTWMVNLPVTVFMIGNMILSGRRSGDDIENASALTSNIIIGVLFILISIACTVFFAVKAPYKDRKWLVLRAGEVKTWNSEPEGAASFSANRFLWQQLLSVIVLVCLMYFVITGLAFYDAGNGFLLTERYMNDAFAVRVWDIAGATVGMGALPLVFMFIGVELQGDLPPDNYKPLMVWAACMNTFVTSIFMYATQWDAFDRGVVTTHLISMFIMILLCLWAVACIVLYAFVQKYRDAPWLKPLADPVPPPQVSPEPKYEATPEPAPVPEPAVVQVEEPEVWGPQPVMSGAGYRHVTVRWEEAPEVDPEEVEFRVTATVEGEREVIMVPGTKVFHTIYTHGGASLRPRSTVKVEMAYRKISDRGQPGEGWVVGDKHTPVTLACNDYGLPAGFRLKPAQSEAGSGHVTASWALPVGLAAEDVEFHTSISKPGEGSLEEELHSGRTSQLRVSSFNGQNVFPGDEFDLVVKFRHIADCDEPEEGWQAASEPCRLATTSDSLPADWRMRPYAAERGTQHIVVGWGKPPGTDDSGLQYRLALRGAEGKADEEEVITPGEQVRHTVQEVDMERLAPGQAILVTMQYRHASDAGEANGGWQRGSEETRLTTRTVPAEGWKLEPKLRDAQPNAVSVGWAAPEDTTPDEVEYLVKVAKEDGSGEAAQVLPGEQTSLRVAEAGGEPLAARQVVQVDVAYRLKADSFYDNEGWQQASASGPTPFRTARPGPPEGWRLQPRQVGAGGGHVDVAWDKVPGVEEGEVEYRLYHTNAGGERVDNVLPGSQATHTIDNHQGKTLTPGQELYVNVEYRYAEDAGHDDGGWEGTSAQLNVRTADDGLAEDFQLQPRTQEASMHHIVAAWDAPPGVDAADIEYLAVVHDAEGGEVQACTVAEPSVRIDSLAGARLEANQQLPFSVAFRHKGDATEPACGWQRRSDVEALGTAGDGLPADWGVQPVQDEAGSHHVVAEWNAPPGVAVTAVEYLAQVKRRGAQPDFKQLPGDQVRLTIEEVGGTRLEVGEEVLVTVALRLKEDATPPTGDVEADGVEAAQFGGGWQRHGTAPMKTAELPDGWRVEPQLESVDTSGAVIAWKKPHGFEKEELDYKAMVTDEGKTVEDVTVITDGQNRFRIDDLNGEPLKAGQTVYARVVARLKADEHYEGGGWKRESEVLPVSLGKLRPPADWLPVPRCKSAGAHHVVAAWEPAPGVPTSSVEYRVVVARGGAQEESVVPGSQSELRIATFGGDQLQPGDEVTAQVAYRDVTDAEWSFISTAEPLRTNSDGLPSDWRMTLRVEEAGSKHILTEWLAPPDTEETDLQYRVTTCKPDGSSPESSIGDGTVTQHRVTTLAGRPLQAGDRLVARVEYRHRGDAEEANGGWQRSSEETPLAAAPALPSSAYRTEVKAGEATESSVEVTWAPVQGFDPNQVEYLVTVLPAAAAGAGSGAGAGAAAAGDVQVVPGTVSSLKVTAVGGEALQPAQSVLANVAVRVKADAGYEGEGWQAHSGPVEVSTRAPERRFFKLEPKVPKEHLADIVVMWQRPDYVSAAEIEYKLNVTEHDHDNDPTTEDQTEEFILEGDQQGYMIDSFSGEPIIPGELFTVDLAWRYIKDRDAPEGGWQGHSGPITVKTKDLVEPAALLESRVPRIFLLEELMFKSNKADITAGQAGLPAVAKIMQEHPDLMLKVEGHVNFGQKDHAAKKLSKARAKAVCHKLASQGIDEARLEPLGLGWTRARFPRGSPMAKKNRRVEFNIKPGSALYEKLVADAQARLDAINNQ